MIYFLKFKFMPKYCNIINLEQNMIKALSNIDIHKDKVDAGVQNKY